MVVVVVVFVVVVVVLGVCCFGYNGAAHRGNRCPAKGARVHASLDCSAHALAVLPYMAKSESSEIELGMMYFRYVNHFPGRISSMCNLSSIIKVIEQKLTKCQLNLFKKDIFRHFLEC
ncbi:hypothetical protein WN944_001399 [Citrus x changshan-huyou]|uniref:Uncharacterized protein n=1 Tax=Citrus x changshan-huyou TaxID=2935761 RepID=A0AAP0QR60_9ROSI